MKIYEALENKSIRDGILRTVRNLSYQVDKNLQKHPYLVEYAEEVRNAKKEIIANFDFWIEKARGFCKVKALRFLC